MRELRLANGQIRETRLEARRGARIEYRRSLGVAIAYRKKAPNWRHDQARAEGAVRASPQLGQGVHREGAVSKRGRVNAALTKQGWGYASGSLTAR